MFKTNEYASATSLRQQFAELLICSADCPYRELCDIFDTDLAEMPTNMPCLHEMAVFVTRFRQYCEELGIRKTDAVDTEQVRQLVYIEIKLLRCNKFTAIHPEVIYAPAEDGSGRKKIHPVALYELKLMEQHSRLLKSLGIFG